MSSDTEDFVVCGAVPYGWVIEYMPSQAAGLRYAFTRNDGQKDLAYVMQRAADLHGIVIPQYRRERRAPTKGQTPC